MSGFPSMQPSLLVRIDPNSEDKPSSSLGSASSSQRPANAARAGGAPMAFFALPDDILITVLQSWLENDARYWLKALSALDIACCSSKHRQLLVSLFAAVTIPHTMSSDEHLSHEFNCTGMYIDDPSYLNWLSSRRVQVEFLQLGGAQEWEQATSIKHITAVLVDAPVICLALQHCPNVESILIAPRDNEATLVFWTTLSQSPLNFDSLECMRVFEHKPFDYDDLPESRPEDMLATLRRMPKLKVFAGSRITALTDDLVDILCWCAQLEMVMTKTIDILQAVRLLTACKHLHTLSLETFSEPTTAVIGAILHAGREHLKRFVIILTTHLTHSLEIFVQIMEQHEWLDELQIDHFVFCRSTKALKLGLGNLRHYNAISLIERIALHIPMIVTFSLVVPDGHCGVLAACQLLCGKVEHLTASPKRERIMIVQSVVDLASACPLLKHLTLSGRCNDTGLVNLAAVCSGLQSFTLHKEDWWSEVITDVGMAALLNSPNLVDISLVGDYQFTHLTLNAIATRGRPFKSLTVEGSAEFIDMEEIADFHELAKQKQLIPVPVVIVPASRWWSR